MGTGKFNARDYPATGLASHPGGRVNSPGHFMLQKLERSTALKDLSTCMQILLHVWIIQGETRSWSLLETKGNKSLWWRLFRIFSWPSVLFSFIDRVSIDCCETETRVIILANQKGRRQYRTNQNSKQIHVADAYASTGKRVRTSHDWLSCFYFWLDNKVAWHLLLLQIRWQSGATFQSQCKSKETSQLVRRMSIHISIPVTMTMLAVHIDTDGHIFV